MKWWAGLWMATGMAGPVTAMAAQTRAAIYADGRIFVRRVVEQPLVRGTNTVSLPLELIVPGSLVALDSGVTVVSARSPLPPLPVFTGDPTPMLRRMIGRQVMILYPTPRDTLRATVVSADPPRYRMADGSIMVAQFGSTLFPSDLIDIERVTIATVESRGPRPRFEVGYTLSGLPWQAQYALILTGAGRGRISGVAVVQTDAIALDSAEIVVVESQVARAPPHFPVRSQQELSRLGIYNQQQQQSPVPPVEPLRSYAVVGRHPLRRGEIASLPLMEEGAVDVAMVYRVPGVFGPQSPAGQTNLVQGQPPRTSMTTTQLAASLRYRITADPRSPPARGLPAGIARIYGPGGSAGLLLLAEAAVPEPSSAGVYDLVVGPSTSVSADRIPSDTRIEQDTVVSETGSRRVRATATVWEDIIRLRNNGSEPAVVEIVEQLGDPFTVVSSSTPPEVLSPGVARFRLTIPPGRVERFTARLRVAVP